jgi:hypothetical protein
VLLTTRRRFGEGTGDKDGAAEEIDASGCGRGTPAAGRFGAKGEAPGARAGGMYDERRSRRHSPATRSSGRPSKVSRWDSLVVARVGARRECGAQLVGRAAAGALGSTL